jgi:NAD-dependent dihydropyrimidine dehydrogenase PreA subunit
MTLNSQSLAERLEELANQFMDSPENSNGHPAVPEKAFASPLIGYAGAADPIWESFKTSVDPQYLTPAAAFSALYPDSPLVLEDLSVMVFVLPQTRLTMKDQNQAKDIVSERWARSRVSHQRVVDGLALHLKNSLEAMGIEAAVPDHLPQWKVFPSDAFQLTSMWSHRHAGFAAGLGTFGLCDGLITPIGKAHRMGSVIVNHPLPATPRDYGIDQFQKYCLFFNSGTCGLCIKRCPAGAITEQGHNKARCSDFLKASAPYIESRWPEIAGGYGCGLCQSKVPCAAGIPAVPAKAACSC